MTLTLLIAAHVLLIQRVLETGSFHCKSSKDRAGFTEDLADAIALFNDQHNNRLPFLQTGNINPQDKAHMQEDHDQVAELFRHCQYEGLELEIAHNNAPGVRGQKNQSKGGGLSQRMIHSDLTGSTKFENPKGIKGAGKAVAGIFAAGLTAIPEAFVAIRRASKAARTGVASKKSAFHNAERVLEGSLEKKDSPFERVLKARNRVAKENKADTSNIKPNSKKVEALKALLAPAVAAAAEAKSTPVKPTPAVTGTTVGTATAAETGRDIPDASSVLLERTPSRGDDDSESTEIGRMRADDTVIKEPRGESTIAPATTAGAVGSRIAALKAEIGRHERGTVATATESRHGVPADSDTSDTPTPTSGKK